MTDRDATIAEWDVLYHDPGYELRLLGLRPAPAEGMVRGTPPSKRFLTAVRGTAPHQSF
jgi:hypothetical protein